MRRREGRREEKRREGRAASPRRDVSILTRESYSHLASVLASSRRDSCAPAGRLLFAPSSRGACVTSSATYPSSYQSSPTLSDIFSSRVSSPTRAASATSLSSMALSRTAPTSRHLPPGARRRFTTVGMVAACTSS